MGGIASTYINFQNIKSCWLSNKLQKTVPIQHNYSDLRSIVFATGIKVNELNEKHMASSLTDTTLHHNLTLHSKARLRCYFRWLVWRCKRFQTASTKLSMQCQSGQKRGQEVEFTYVFLHGKWSERHGSLIKWFIIVRARQAVPRLWELVAASGRSLQLR